MRMAKQLRVGATVRVPWGMQGDVEAKVLEIWGDPPAHVKVRLTLNGEPEPFTVLLSISTLSAA